jgi:hypothetical protein
MKPKKLKPLPFISRNKMLKVSKYIFTIEFVVFLIIILVCLYLFFNVEKKHIEYEFTGFDDEYLLPFIETKPTDDIKFKKKRKHKKKKRVWKSQEYCRQIIEKLFPGYKFPSVRPKFLRNPVSGKNLELDCYNKELKLALEYDGKQHAEYVPHFHKKGVDEFRYQVVKDDFKTIKCKVMGISLIRVPHYIIKIDLEKYIRNEINKLPYEIKSKSIL